MLPDLARRWPSLPIVVVTVEDDAMQAARMLRLGALDYVAKERCAGGLLPQKLKEVLANVELTRQLQVARILVETLQERRRRLLGGPRGPETRLPDSLIQPLDGLTRDYCALVLHACGDRIREAAHRLHVPYSSLRDDLVRWGVTAASAGGDDEEPE